MALTTNFKTKDIEVDDDLKSYVAKRVAKVEKFIPEDDTSAIADIELARTTTDQRSGQIFRAEINLKIAGSYLRAEDEAEDIREAIDTVQGEIIRELKKVREKKRTQVRKGAREAKEILTNPEKDSAAGE